MPLKEADLKDAETYKKSSRLDLPKVVSGNPKFWVYKDVELPNASGKPQKYPAFLALVDDSGIRRAMAGKKLICKGTCTMKDQTIAFEPTTGRVPYKILKVSVPLLLGKKVWIPTDLEEAVDQEEPAAEAEPAQPQPAATQPSSSTPQAAAAAPAKSQPRGTPPLTAADLTGTWTKLVKDAQAYAAAHPERKADLVRDMTAISALLKANSAAEAKTKIEQMQAALDTPLAAAPAGAPGPAQVAARWTALVKRLQATVATHPEKKPELARVTAGIPDLIRAGKLDLAMRQMDAVEQVLKENPREKEYRAHRQALEGRLATALTDPARDASGLRAINAFAVEKANAGDFESALKALLKLEQALTIEPAAAGAPTKPAEQERAEEDEDAEDEEEARDAADFQKDLKGRMGAALAQVRARAPRAQQEPKPQLRFMAYLTAKSSAVIVAKKAGAGMKRLLAEIAGASGGKIARGECIFEKNAYTFVIEKVSGGLAKKLAAALLAETGTRYKVRVRSIDGSVTLDDDTDQDPDATAGGFSKVSFEKLHIGWDLAKEAVEARLGELHSEILTEFNDPEANAAVRNLDKVLTRFNEGLGDVIDSLRGAEPGARPPLAARAIGIADGYLAFLNESPLIAHVEANPYEINIAVRETLAPPLEAVRAELTKLSAG
jgi:hypothetical protein